MNLVYGDPGDPQSCVGYLHLLDKSKFLREPGLGRMELITREPSANLERLVINRREAIDSLVEQGTVEIEWRPD